MSEKRLCALCDGWYGPSEANEHRHPEPQSGPPRDDWLRSGLHYADWVVLTEEGQAWLQSDPNRRAPKGVEMSKQTHIGTNSRTGRGLWHSQLSGRLPYWRGDWSERTPEQLYVEAQSVIADLLKAYPDIASRCSRVPPTSTTEVFRNGS